MTSGKVLALVDELLQATADDEEAARLLRARRRQHRDEARARRDDAIRSVRVELLPNLSDRAAAAEIAAALHGARTATGGSERAQAEAARRKELRLQLETRLGGRIEQAPSARRVRKIIGIEGKPLAAESRCDGQLSSGDLSA